MRLLFRTSSTPSHKPSLGKPRVRNPFQTSPPSGLSFQISLGRGTRVGSKGFHPNKHPAEDPAIEDAPTFQEYTHYRGRPYLPGVHPLSRTPLPTRSTPTIKDAPTYKEYTHYRGRPYLQGLHPLRAHLGAFEFKLKINWLINLQDLFTKS